MSGKPEVHLSCKQAQHQLNFRPPPILFSKKEVNQESQAAATAKNKGALASAFGPAFTPASQR